jgi:hypothetical protein
MVYISTTILGGIFSFLQVLLILGITFGLSDFLFALGDDAFAGEFDRHISSCIKEFMSTNL